MAVGLRGEPDNKNIFVKTKINKNITFYKNKKILYLHRHSFFFSSYIEKSCNKNLKKKSIFVHEN